MRKSLTCTVFLTLAVGIAAGFLGGCETGGESSALNVTPSSYNTTNKSEAVTFTVGTGTNTTAESGLRDLSLPLEWRVSNPLLGSITAASGYSCTYVRNSRNGIQTITVEDQYGSEGSATVDQQ